MTTEFFMTTEEDCILNGIERIKKEIGGFDLPRIEKYIVSHQRDVAGYVSKAVLLAGERKYQQAHGFLLTAQTQFPNNGLLHHTSATVYEAEGKREEALKESRVAARLNPYSPEIRITLGTLLHRAKKFDEAIGIWENILKIDPSTSFAWNSLARAEFEKGDYKRAINHVNSAVMLAEGSPLYYTFLHNRSQIYLAKGDLESALRDDGEILAHNFQEGIGHIGAQPQFLLNLGKEAEARDYMVRATQLFPIIRSFIRR